VSLAWDRQTHRVELRERWPPASFPVAPCGHPPAHNSLRPHPHPLPMKPSRRPLSLGTPIFRRPRQVRTPFFRRPSATGDLHCAYPCASTAPPAADTDLVDVVTSLNLGNQENSTGLCKKRKKIQSCSPPSRKEWHGPTIPVRLESICFTSSKCS
jgi:hypothetical protein